MISAEQRAQIRRLYFGEHWRVGTIAAQLGLHHATVRAALGTDGFASRGAVRPSALDPYVELIRETLQRYPRLTGTRVHEMLRARGYGGSVVQVRRKIRQLELRPRPAREAFFHLETLPGEQGQVDWGEFGKIRIDGVERRLFGFVMVLSHSRAMWAHFSVDQTMSSVVRGHVECFGKLGGVPRALLYDNMKTVVLERDGDAIRFHPRFLELSAYYLFVAHPCRPARGNEKGKVERAIRYLRTSFFAGRDFTDLDDVRRQFARWRDEVAHARPWPKDGSCTVAEAHAKERSTLLGLPGEPLQGVDVRGVVAQKQPYVVYDTNRYSIPWTKVGRALTLAATDQQIRVLDGDELVACHRRSWQKQAWISDPAHLEGLWEHKAKAAGTVGRARVLAEVPEAEALYEALQRRNEALASHTLKLCGLLDTYGAARVREAVATAIERGTPRADSVAYLLEKRATQEGKAPPIAPHFERPEIGGLRVKNHDLEGYDAIYND